MFHHEKSIAKTGKKASEEVRTFPCRNFPLFDSQSQKGYKQYINSILKKEIYYGKKAHAFTRRRKIGSSENRSHHH
ncbi:MAG TPA: hypothetical protein DEB43_00080 [Desulfovibrio sp.]|nr:hypothetical protein [Desulfovibrio sp.]